MKKLPPRYLSENRKKISAKLERLKKLYLQACDDSVLFHGKPGTVYRKCGKTNCRCVAGGADMHGPYKIIRVFKDGKNTQVTLKKGEFRLLEMAKDYQQQVNNRKEIKRINVQLMLLFEKIMKERTVWSKEEIE